MLFDVLAVLGGAELGGLGVDIPGAVVALDLCVGGLGEEFGRRDDANEEVDVLLGDGTLREEVSFEGVAAGSAGSNSKSLITSLRQLPS